MTTKINEALFRVALAAINGLEKSSFTEPPQPQDPSAAGAPPGAPPMDPSMMGGAPPMDPSMAGGAGSMPPIDPAMLAQLAGAGGMPPGMAPAADGLAQNGVNASPPSAASPDLKQQIKEVLSETGVIKAPKIKPEQQFEYIANCLQSIASQLSLQLPPPPSVDDGQSSSKDKPNNSANSKSAAVSHDNFILSLIRKAQGT
jgi:hypothetical protein